MKNTEYVEKLIQITTLKTLYVMGAFGAPLNAKNKTRYKNNNVYNRQPGRQAKIDAATADTFAFDCVGYAVKSVLWGFTGDPSKVYGGAKYKSNGVPDSNVTGFLKKCTDVSDDFSDLSKLIPGEYLYMKDHCGVYIGDGLAVECSPAWKDGVQITAVNHKRDGYHTRTWLKHGKLPYIEYPAAPVEWIPQVGEKVIFTGNTHYTNANAITPKYCRSGYATVRRIYRWNTAKHPINIKGIKPCTANGWVNKKDVIQDIAK